MNPVRFRMVLFFILLVSALALCFALALPFLHVIAWAVVLAVVVYPLHMRIKRRIRNPSAAAAYSCLGVFVLIIVPLSLLVADVIAQATSMVTDVQKSLETGAPPQWMRPLQAPAAMRTQRWLEQHIGLSNSDFKSMAQEGLSWISSYLAKRGVNIVRVIGLGMVQLMMILLTLFFLLRDSQRMFPVVRAFIPLEKEQAEELLSRVVDTIHATVHGATVVAVAQGTLVGLAFWVLGLSSPLLWGVVATLLCFVPLLGSPVVWVPAVVVLAMQGLYGKAIALTLWGLLVVGLADNVLRPMLVGARAHLHVMIVFFSVWGGLLLMGPLGLVLGPVILSVTMALIDILRYHLAEKEFWPYSSLVRVPDTANSDNGEHPAEDNVADSPSPGSSPGWHGF